MERLLAPNLQLKQVVRLAREGTELMITAVRGLTTEEVILYTGDLWDPLVLAVQADGTLKDPDGKQVDIYPYV